MFDPETNPTPSRKKPSKEGFYIAMQRIAAERGVSFNVPPPPDTDPPFLQPTNGATTKPPRDRTSSPQPKPAAGPITVPDTLSRDFLQQHATRILSKETHEEYRLPGLQEIFVCRCVPIAKGEPPSRWMIYVRLDI